MTDSFEFTLNNPLTEEQWDMITDVDFDQTDRITFHTKHGKEVEFAKVIRCEDCRYFAMIEDGSNELICDHRDGCMTPKPNGFCNYAEPKRKSKI